MARVTVEDCLENVENRFALVLLAAKRARQLTRTAVEPNVPWEGDKATVVALREIAAGFTDFTDSSQGIEEKQEIDTDALIAQALKEQEEQSQQQQE